MKDKNKLKKRKQFNWTFKNGSSVHSKDLTIVYTPTRSNDFKVGFSVTKKVGKAVVRNKVKRRLREIVAKFENILVPCRTFIVVAKPTAKDVPFLELKEEVLYLLKKANLCKDEEK